MTTTTKHGGWRPGAGNRKDDVSTIILDDDMRRMLNIIVGHERGLRGEKVSHKQVVKELILARYGQLDEGWQSDAEDDSGDIAAPPISEA